VGDQGPDQSNRAPFPEKRASRGQVVQFEKTMGITLAACWTVSLLGVGIITPVELADHESEGSPGTPKPRQERGTTICPAGELDRDGSAGGRYRPLSMGAGALVAKEGWPRDPMLSDCDAVLIDGAKLGHYGLSLLAQRLRISNVTRLTRSLRSRCGARPSW
jgi:hypothetical protein